MKQLAWNSIPRISSSLVHRVCTRPQWRGYIKSLCWQLFSLQCDDHSADNRFYFHAMDNHSLIRLFHDGRIEWFPLAQVHTTCDLKLVDYPLDSHQCHYQVKLLPHVLQQNMMSPSAIHRLVELNKFICHLRVDIHAYNKVYLNFIKTPKL